MERRVRNVKTYFLGNFHLRVGLSCGRAWCVSALTLTVRARYIANTFFPSIIA